VVAAILALFLVCSSLIAIVVSTSALAAHMWKLAVMGIVAVPALAIARVFVVGAWSGEEPAFDFDETDISHRVT
jgi:hypothetical protein